MDRRRWNNFGMCSHGDLSSEWKFWLFIWSFVNEKENFRFCEIKHQDLNAIVIPCFVMEFYESFLCILLCERIGGFSLSACLFLCFKSVFEKY
jgi:hypothetical protein